VGNKFLRYPRSSLLVKFPLRYMLRMKQGCTCKMFKICCKCGLKNFLS